MPRPSPLRPCRRAFPCSPPFIASRNAHRRYVVASQRAPPVDLALPSDFTGCGSSRHPLSGPSDELTRSDLGRLRPCHCIRTKKRFRRLPPGRRAERNRPECDRKADPLGYIGSPPLLARAGTGTVGIEEATMHTAIPTFVGFEGALEQGPPDRPEAPA